MSRTLGPMVPSLTASSTCLLLTVNVLESTLMDNLKLAGDPQATRLEMIDRRRAPDQMADLGNSSPIRFPGSPEGWWGDEGPHAEAQAPQAPREQGDQAAGNVPALRPRCLFSAGAP